MHNHNAKISFLMDSKKFKNVRNKFILFKDFYINFLEAKQELSVSLC